MSASLYQRVSEELLPHVRRPAQYIGNEVNQLVRPGDWERAEIRVAIGFPDAYTIGMSHLGCQILYWLCNHTPGVCAERTYAPWIDAERIMRERGIPLFTWDTRQAVRDADIFAISLQYEMCFTTVLNMLDLAGIPMRSAERNRPQDTAHRAVAHLQADQSHDRDQNRDRNQSRDRKGAVDSVLSPESSALADAVKRGIEECGGRHGGVEEWPLIIVGGPQADNAEPMAGFVDLVVIGDGEHSMAAILEAVREYKRADVPRREMIALLAKRFPWCYAPNLYDVQYHDDGTIAAMTPKIDGLPTQIERCKTPDFDDVPFPTRPLVPWVEVVHDRISIEIMRGCPQVCRFCHAGYTKRPLHYRTPDRILEIAEEAYWATGQHEIGLLSLSTADYPLLRELADKVNERFAPRMVNLSFPSLRIDKMLQNIPWMANSVRKGGITMAVEAARDDMRRAIRKKVTDGNLMDGVREIYKAGWKRVKLYFMAGFPGERDDDIRGIWELANAVSAERRALGKPPAHVTASVGWLVPKPFTPLQWMAQPPVEYFLDVQERLRGLSRRRKRGSGGREQGAGSGEQGSGSASDQSRDHDQSRDRGGALVAAGLRPGRTSAAHLGTPNSELGTGDSPQHSVLSTQSSRSVRAATVRERSTHLGTRNSERGTGDSPQSSRPIRAATVREPSTEGTQGEHSRRPRGNVVIRTHHPQRSILEAVFARGDRRLGRVIHEAWRRGARFDGWDECYDDSIWHAAFAAAGVDPAFYAHRERSYDEILPWDHVGLRIGRPYLEKSYADVFEQVGESKPQPENPTATQHSRPIRAATLRCAQGQAVRERSTEATKPGRALPLIAD